MHLYHNPVKKSYKVTELEIHASFEGLQADLARLAAASLWAEIVQKSFGAGEMSGGLFGLFRDSLALLEHADPARGTVRHDAVPLAVPLAWPGTSPTSHACDSCGAALGERGPPGTYPRSHALLCAACGAHAGLPLPRVPCATSAPRRRCRFCRRSRCPMDAELPRGPPGDAPGHRAVRPGRTARLHPVGEVGPMRVFAALPLPPDVAGRHRRRFSSAAERSRRDPRGCAARPCT